MSTVHVRVLAGGEHYALPVDDVLEVAEVGDVTPVPGAPSGVLGVRNLRGQVIPVVDLATLLGLESQSPPQRIVVTEDSARRSAFAVESVVDVGPLPPPTESADSEYLRGAALLDGDLIGVVNLNAALEALTPKAVR